MERTVLRRSIAVSAVLSLLGVGWGLAAGSQVILLDGMYGVIGIATSGLLLKASALAGEGPTRAYPFGREAATPMAIGIQGAVQLATLLYAAVEAVYVILRGGSLVAAGPAIVYSAAVTAACVVVWLWIRSQARTSDLLASEALGWRLAAVRGGAMLAGFTLLLAVTGTGLAWIGPYIDPVMVLITCVLLVAPPVTLVRHALRELLEARPAPETRRGVEGVVARVTGAHQLPEPVVRLSKVGGKLYVEVEGQAAPSVTIAQEHAVRTELERELEAALPHEIWLTLELVPHGTVPVEATA
jgi:predicted Co/Zn/Cd cation transporter (cation efflux family)